MAIFRHPDGSYHRFPFTPRSGGVAVDINLDADKNWRQIDGARPGIEIHRDGKRMRNTAPTPSKG